MKGAQWCAEGKDVRVLRTVCTLILSSVALVAQAQNASSNRIDIPSGDLVSALDQLARRSGLQFVYRADQLKGLHTPGTQGAVSTGEAVDLLLQGSGFVARRDASGAMVIVRDDAPSFARSPSVSPVASDAAGDTAGANAQSMVELQKVQVTGSRIPRTLIEGPAPVIVITAEEIHVNGFTSVPDVLRAMTQNSGETQSQQSRSGADFSPGAQQVDLRGLGPNHTLVLINGRRIADFPLPFIGRSNFTDVSNIPLGMIDRIEVLTGSASAVYGSDAISGVVNFILKKRADGTTVDFRVGNSQRGGNESLHLSVSSGFEHGAFSAVYGFELQSQNPLWAYQRSAQDSTQDAPVAAQRIARRTFLRTNNDDEYLDPGAACQPLSHLNRGSVRRASRPGWGIAGEDGYYCGSDESVAYGTIVSKRGGADAFGSLGYAFETGSEWFADLRLGYHELAIFRDVSIWGYQTPDGNEAGYFFNQATGQVENWQRQFTPEESNGLSERMVRTRQKNFSVNTGFKGSYGERWDWELALSHSQYRMDVSWPRIVAAKANAFFLGQQLGTNDEGLPIFNADPRRLYTPLTPAEFDAIAAHTTYHPQSRTDTLSYTLNNGELFSLPAGPVGFAGTIELGNQRYDLNPDPRATQYYYYSWRDSDGQGSRDRWALAGEVRAPLLDSLNASLAGRYDQYRYGGTKIDKITYSAGLEWRPLESLLVRGSYGTAFRAPDLHYVFAGEGNLESYGIDYYRCRTEEPGSDIVNCRYADENIIVTRSGNRKLEPETSTSWTAGLVWSPWPGLDVSVDYFDIDLRDQVKDLRTDDVLQDEANCRIGRRIDGTPVDVNSPSCADAISRVSRVSDGRLHELRMRINPINVARENTSGIDFSTHYRWETALGNFRFAGTYTWVRKHESQQYTNDPFENQFAVNSGFDIPRSKASASVSWEKNRWSATLHGQRLGKLPSSSSYDKAFDPTDGTRPWVGATYRFNTSVQYRFSDHAQLSLIVDNLFDKMPPKDTSYLAYPYYDISWFDTIGRQFYLQYTHKFGGSGL